jgi:isopenicillin N synthase-like dioxygenase
MVCYAYVEDMAREVLKTIPLVDLKDFTSADPGVRSDAVQLTEKGLHDIGFLFVKTPEIAEKLPRIYPVFKELFTLPEKTLLRYERPDIHHQRGYTPSYSEIGIFCQKSGKNGEPEPDSKKNWFIGPEHDDISEEDLITTFPDLYAENVWPTKRRRILFWKKKEMVPGFKEASLELYEDLFAVGKKVLGALEKPLGYDEGFFEEVVRDSPTSLRPLYYPPVAEGVGACDHTDINYITVLPAPTREGLWVKTRSGEWIRGMAPEGYSLVQVGDMLQYTTGGEFHSAVHKVDPSRGEGRYSTALFGHARSSVNLQPAPQWEADPEKYPSLTAGDFLHKRLKEIGLAKQKAKDEKSED